MAGGDVVYFHGKTREMGALVVPCRVLLRSLAFVRKMLGPDVPFMAASGEVGFDYDQAEYDAEVKSWP